MLSCASYCFWLYLSVSALSLGKASVVSLNFLLLGDCSLCFGCIGSFIELMSNSILFLLILWV